jgi:glycosyltransferase involved in cell wall biosynthesis
MKIGIDVHSIGSGKGGNETYYRGLIEGLGTSDSHHEYFLYATHPAAVQAACAHYPNFVVRRIKPSSPYLRIPLCMPLQARNGVDVYHAQFILPPYLKCSTVTTIPDIAFEHVPEMFPPYQRLWSKWLIRRSAMQADHVITVSQYSKDDLVKTYGLSPERITVTHLAVAAEFWPRKKNEAREVVARKYGVVGPYVLYVGRLQGRKNLPTLLDAFARLWQPGCPHQLVLAGKADSLSGALCARAKTFASTGTVRLLGFVPSEDLPWLYSAADVFVYPSLYEGFGLPVLEAMASGVPVITSRGSAMEEIAADSALLVDPRDDVDIASALTRVLEDSSLRERMVRSGLQRSSHFSYARTAQETLDVYEKVSGTDATNAYNSAFAADRKLCS